LIRRPFRFVARHPNLVVIAAGPSGFLIALEQARLLRFQPLQAARTHLLATSHAFDIMTKVSQPQRQAGATLDAVRPRSRELTWNRAIIAAAAGAATPTVTL
jgi:hypothetical protein